MFVCKYIILDIFNKDVILTRTMLLFVSKIVIIRIRFLSVNVIKVNLVFSHIHTFIVVYYF